MIPMLVHVPDCSGLSPWDLAQQKQELCVGYFMQGFECIKGDSCPYLHKIAPEIIQAANVHYCEGALRFCNIYAATGVCTFKGGCHFPHKMTREGFKSVCRAYDENLRVEIPKKETKLRPCIFYNSLHGCRHGDACNFVHVGENNPANETAAIVITHHNPVHGSHTPKIFELSDAGSQVSQTDDESISQIREFLRNGEEKISALMQCMEEMSSHLDILVRRQRQRKQEQDVRDQDVLDHDEQDPDDQEPDEQETDEEDPSVHDPYEPVEPDEQEPGDKEPGEFNPSSMD